MVVDYKLFSPGKDLRNNTLCVTEEIPGLVMSQDRTSDLRRGYWPSYNRPFFDEIYRRSGYPEMAKKHDKDGEAMFFSYQLAPRAKIFRRDHALVTDLASFKRVMRENHYQADPFSQGNPGHAICARFDLGSNTRTF